MEKVMSQENWVQREASSVPTANFWPPLEMKMVWGPGLALCPSATCTGSCQLLHLKRRRTAVHIRGPAQLSVDNLGVRSRCTRSTAGGNLPA